MDNGSWKIHACAWATTAAVAYVLCAIFDALFPPYGLIALLAPASPWPLSGSLSGYVIGFLTFVIAGLVLGAIYGLAWGFWVKRLR